MFDDIEAGGRVPKYPAVLSFRVERAKISSHNPPFWLMGVREFGPFVQSLPQVAVERRKGGTRDHRAIVIRPSTNQRVQPLDDLRDIPPAQAVEFSPQVLPMATQSGRTRFINNLVP